MMKAVATFHPQTSVVASLNTTLSNDEDLHFLVIAKSSSLEVFVILPDSLRLQCRLDLWGRVSSLQAIPTTDTARHNLLVLTDHPDPRLLLLEYIQDTSGSGPSLKTLKTISLHENNARPAEFLNSCVVDHRGKVAVVSTYASKLRVVELENGLISSDFDAPVRELNILSLCFLRITNARATVLAILYKDYLQKLRVTSHDLSLSDLELSASPSSFLPEFAVSDEDANLLIPVPPQTKGTWNNNGGVLVLGGNKISFYPIDRKQKKKTTPATPKALGAKVPQAEANWTYSDITAWSEVDAEGTRFLLGDSFGRLAILALDLERLALDIVFLGQISTPSSLTLLASQFIYVGSHFGDSQLISIAKDKSSANGSYVDISETHQNIAPIMDAVVEDIDNSGQPTVVTCSGGGNSGSLRIIRNGANFIEDARIDGISNIFGMWPLKRHYDDEYHQFILVATDSQSHLLELPTRGETSFSRSNDLTDMRLDVPTLSAANILNRVATATGRYEYRSGSYVAQVTRDAVLLLNTQTGLAEDRWTPDPGRNIVLADISPSQICIAVSGGLVVLFNLRDDKIREQSQKTFIEPDGTFSEISALTITPLKSGARYSSVVVLGFWSSHEIRSYTLPAFEPTEGMPAIMPHLPRSLLLHDFGGEEGDPQPCLMVGLANGTVVTLPSGNTGKFGEKKVFALGGAPVVLSRCIVNKQPAIFASGIRSAVFYQSRGTVNHSPILVKDVTSISSLNSAAFPSSMALSTMDGLVIGRILELEKLHIRTIAMGTEIPTRIAYNPSARSFGVACLKQDHGTLKRPVAVVSSFKLVDDADFRTTHEFSLETDEDISAVATVSLNLADSNETFFAIGSTYFNENEREPSRGRVLVFSTGTSGKQIPHLYAVAETQGAVNALTCLNGKLVVAINTSVDIYILASNEKNKLVRLTGWNHNYLVMTVVVANDQIVVGDAVSSVAVLRLENDRLVTVARDYSPLWPLCIGMFDQETIIGATNDYNLFSYTLQPRGNKMLLEQNGLYHLDEIVNKCVPGCLDAAGVKFGLQTRQLLFTSTGRIVVIVDVNDDLSRLLSSLERNVASIVKGPGDVDHTQFRAPSNLRGRSDANAVATGFLDGDLLERFLDYPASSGEVTRILSGRNEAERIDASYTHLRAILESLRSQH